MQSTIFLIIASIALLLVAWKTNNKLLFEIIRFVFGFVFLTAFCMRYNLYEDTSDATHMHIVHQGDALILGINWACFLFLYFCSIWILFFKDKLWLLYLPWIVFGIILLMLCGFDDSSAFVDMILPLAIAFLPLYYLAYRKFVRIVF